MHDDDDTVEWRPGGQDRRSHLSADRGVIVALAQLQVEVQALGESVRKEIQASSDQTRTVLEFYREHWEKIEARSLVNREKIDTVERRVEALPTRAVLEAMELKLAQRDLETEARTKDLETWRTEMTAEIRGARKLARFQLAVLTFFTVGAGSVAIRLL